MDYVESWKDNRMYIHVCESKFINWLDRTASVEDNPDRFIARINESDLVFCVHLDGGMRRHPYEIGIGTPSPTATIVTTIDKAVWIRH